jgi:hypothetical protein
MADDFEIIDVASAKEDWSRYKLEDGTIVKIRFILVKTIRQAHLDQFGNPLYDLNSENVVGMLPSKSSLGKPSPPFSQTDLPSSIVENDMKFETIQEPWNEYHLTDGTVLRVKLALVTIAKTNKYNDHGEPIYLVNAQPTIKGTPYTQRRK